MVGGGWGEDSKVPIFSDVPVERVEGVEEDGEEPAVWPSAKADRIKTDWHESKGLNVP